MTNDNEKPHCLCRTTHCSGMDSRESVPGHLSVGEGGEMNTCGQCNTQFSDGTFHSCQPGLTLYEAEELLRWVLENRSQRMGRRFEEREPSYGKWSEPLLVAREVLYRDDPAALLQQWQKERK